MNYESKNTIEHLSLHDCMIEDAKITNSNLILEFEHIDVLDTHPLNPYGVAKCTGKASLIFENYSVLQSHFFDTRGIKKRIIVEEDARKTDVAILDLTSGFEVLEVKRLEENNDFSVCKFFGECSNTLNSDFGEFTLKFKNVLICWDELNEDAWFVDFPTRNQ
jgi:hypothetical protein